MSRPYQYTDAELLKHAEGFNERASEYFQWVQNELNEAHAYGLDGQLSDKHWSTDPITHEVTYRPMAKKSKRTVAKPRAIDHSCPHCGKDTRKAA